jgi:hypothetical protein
VIDRRVILIVLLGFTLIAALIHINGSPASLLSDDFVILKAVAQGSIFGMWADRSMDFFRPLASALFWVEYRAWGLNPMGYRCVSVLLDSLCALLVVLTGLSMTRSRGSERDPAKLLALLAGILFLTSVSHSEPVNWMACQADLLSTLFGLLAFWSYVKGRTGSSNSYLIVSVAIFGLSLFSKESVVTLPLLLLCYEALGWHSKGRDGRAGLRDILKLLPYFLAVGVYVLIRRLVLGTMVGGYGTRFHIGLHMQRLLIGLASFPTRTYLPPMPTRPIAVGAFGLVLLIVVVAMYASWKKRRTAPPRTVPLFAVTYLVSLLPVLNLSISKTTVSGERLIYFPSAFAMLLLVAVLDYIMKNVRTLAIVVACLATVSGLMLFRSGRGWYEATTLARDVTTSLEAAQSRGDLVILSLADNLGGPYVFRNGFREMIWFTGMEDKWDDVVVLAQNNLMTRKDSIRVDKTATLIRVTQTDPRSTFISPAARLQAEVGLRGYRSVGFGASAYAFELDPDLSDRMEAGTYPAYFACVRLEPSVSE